MHDDMMNKSPDNHEAAMARADLYKLANYSMKLFKMIHEGQELEGWVQAKITKAADYIASVYHFMEYEMKSSDYGSKLENSDVYSESVRRAFEQKLMEAKKKADKVKKEADKVEEGWDDMLKAVKDKAGPQPSGGSGVKKGSRYGGSKQKADDVEKDDEDEKPKKNTKVKEAAKPDYLDFDKDGNKKEPMKKALKDKKVKEDTRLAMRRGPGADMIRYEKDSPAPGAKKHRDDTAKAAKELRASGKKLGDDDEAKVGDKTVTRYNRDHYVKEVAMSPAPAQKKSGIPSTATTTVPGMRATPADLKKANSSAALGEGKCNHSAKGKKCPVHGLKECGSMYESKKKVVESHDPIYKLNVVKANEKSGQLKITYWLRQETGLPKDAFVYFDDADLVYGEKTIVPDALVNPKLKMKDLVVALEKAIQEKETEDGGMYEAKNLKQQAAIAIAKKKAK